MENDAKVLELFERLDDTITKAAQSRHLVAKDRIWKAEGIDDGIYSDARKQGRSATELLHDKELEAGFGEMDGSPSPYFGKTQREISEIRMKCFLRGETPPLTAVEKQMIHHGVSRMDTVEKFFTLSPTLRTVFPEIIVQDVQDGLVLAGMVGELAADRTQVPFTDAFIRGWKVEDAANDQDVLQLRRVAKGAELPKTKITLAERAVQLAKHGRSLQMAYEDINGMRIDVLGRLLRRIGLRIQVDETDDVLATLAAGDATSGAPTNVVQPAVSGTIGVADFLEFWSSLPAPFRMTDMVGRKALALTYYTSIVSNFTGGLENLGQSPFSRPREHVWDRGVITTDRFIGIDRNNALTWYESAVVTEEDRIISKQIRESTIAKISGAKIMELDAIAVWDTSF